jgi:LysM repeat protein
MIDRAMAARKAGRYLAPIALLAVGAAIFLVVKAHVNATTHASAGSQLGGTLVQSTRQSSSKTSDRHRHVAATYTVKSGDTVSAIAAHSGVSVAVILRLNPGLNPGALQTGQVIKLRR